MRIYAQINKEDSFEVAHTINKMKKNAILGRTQTFGLKGQFNSSHQAN